MIHFDSSQRIGACGGMLLIVILQLSSGELIKTAVLAAIGGITSYIFTLLIKFLFLRIKQKFK